MRGIRFTILSLYGVSTFTWKFLPVLGGLVGYLLFAPPEWLGLVMAALLALAGHLTKRAACLIWQRPDSRVSELTPRVWTDTFASEPLVSDLQRGSQ